jgi:hypothetical protein
MPSKLKVLLLFALILATAVSAHAGTIALTGWSGGIEASAGGDQIYGWFFTTSAAISVSALGVFDSGQDGLGLSHDVGIYRTSDQSLLLSATLPAGSGSTLLDGFRYIAITPYDLPADSYVIVMTMVGGIGDRQYINAASATTSAPVTYDLSAFGMSSGGLAYPGFPGVFESGMFGPNFQFDDSPGEIPEPASVLLLASGAFVLTFLRRRRLSN